MKRVAIEKRADWQKKVESQGLLFHTTTVEVADEVEQAIDYRTAPIMSRHTEERRIVYWDESAYYEFTSSEIDELERTTAELHEMCLAAVEHVISTKRYADFGIPSWTASLIERFWNAEPPSLYGRFDLAYDGVNPPKLYEYNADTPTSLLEAAVIQWNWLVELFLPGADQFNSLHDKLIAKWEDIKSYLNPGPVYFGCAPTLEDTMTTTYLRDTASQAGLKTVALLMRDIGWRDPASAPEPHGFVDRDNKRIRNLFKLYPWEWITSEPFGRNVEHALVGGMIWIEPIWKMLLSNKAILAVLWKLYPNHPNLLPAYLDGPRDMRQYVTKPKLSREGNGITIVQGEMSTVPRSGEDCVYQALHPLPRFNSRDSVVMPVIGSWMIDQEPAGIGIRESEGDITNNTSRFVPHLFR